MNCQEKSDVQALLSIETRRAEIQSITIVTLKKNYYNHASVRLFYNY